MLSFALNRVPSSILCIQPTGTDSSKVLKTSQAERPMSGHILDSHVKMEKGEFMKVML